MPTTRPSWDEYGLALADTVSLRADCTKRQVGAVLLDVDNRIIGAGYNGARPGGKSCLAGDCPRGRHYHARLGTLPDGAPWLSGKCACGEVWPCSQSVEPGSSYDTGPGACLSTHAELNARMDVDDRSRLVGARLFVTDEPCDGCVKIYHNTTKVVTMRWPKGVINLADLRKEAA
jgi:dCMP deaminase